MSVLSLLSMTHEYCGKFGLLIIVILCQTNTVAKHVQVRIQEGSHRTSTRRERLEDLREHPMMSF